MKNLSSPLLSWKEWYNFYGITIANKNIGNVFRIFCLLMYCFVFSINIEFNNHRYETGMFKKKQLWIWSYRLSNLLYCCPELYRNLSSAKGKWKEYSRKRVSLRSEFPCDSLEHRCKTKTFYIHLYIYMLSK